MWFRALQRVASTERSTGMLQELWTSHSELQRLLASKGKGPLRDHRSVLDLALPEESGSRSNPGSPQDSVEALLAMLTALEMECAELRGWLPWKSWKTYALLSHEDLQKARREAAVEAVDALHFLFNVMMLLGLTPKMLFALYQVKLEENRKRAEGGY